MTDLLIASVNVAFIILLYKMISKFWNYRIKQRLIQEGFIDEKSLKELFKWNREKDKFQIFVFGVIAGALGFASIIIYFILFEEKEILALGIMLLSLSVACLIINKMMSPKA